MSKTAEQYTVVKEARELLSKVTPWPWFWNVSLKSRCAHLESQARGSLLETVMDFTRWGTGGAAPRFRDNEDLMQRVDMLLRPVEGREHHASWYSTISHPDAEIIARAPELISSLCDEVDRLSAQVSLQSESITTFQSQQRDMKEAIEAALEFMDDIEPTIEKADALAAKLEAAIAPKGSKQ